MSLESKEKAFYQLLGKIAHYTEALHLLYWDSRTQAPKKALISEQKPSVNYPAISLI